MDIRYHLSDEEVFSLPDAARDPVHDTIYGRGITLDDLDAQIHEIQNNDV